MNNNKWTLVEIRSNYDYDEEEYKAHALHIYITKHLLKVLSAVFLLFDKKTPGFNSDGLIIIHHLYFYLSHSILVNATTTQIDVIVISNRGERESSVCVYVPLKRRMHLSRRPRLLSINCFIVGHCG